MCARFSPEDSRSWLIQPKRSPPSPVAVLVITRPWSAGQTAMRELVVRSDDSTITSVWRFRNATSSMNVDEAQPDSASAAIARAIRRLMDVAYRIRPLAGRIPSPRRGGRKESRGRPGCGGSRGPADAPRGREVADELPGGHHQD